MNQIGEEIKAISRKKIVMKEESCKVSKNTMIRKGNNAEKLKRKVSPPEILTSTES